jgi:hypothetical protein
MFRKIMTVTAMAVVMMIELPMAASAASPTRTALNATTGEPQVRIQIGRGRRNRRHYRRYRREYRRYPIRTSRLIRQYYWLNGRRHVRYVRVYSRY